MTTGLTLIIVVAIAYLAAHVAFDWIARRFLIVSGAEYLLLGILIGPQVSGLLSAQAVEAFAPLTTLALGWVGAIVGTQFFLPGLIRIRGITYRLAFIEALATLVVVSAILTLAMAWLFDVGYREALVPAAALGAIGVASAPSGIQVVARRLGRRVPVMRQLEVASAIDGLVAVVAMGVLMCVLEVDSRGASSPFTVTEWVVLSLAIGVVGGALFHLFLGSEQKIDRLVIALGGAIALVSGAAAYLQLSPLLPAMIVGMLLVNTSRNREAIAATLANAERPFYFVLLIFAGAAWAPSLRAWVAPVLLFITARAVGKIGGARLAARLNGQLGTLGPDWGRALLGQGGLALALGLDYMQHPATPLRNLVFTATIASVLLTDLSSARLAQSVVAPITGPSRPDAASDDVDAEAPLAVAEH